MKRFTNSRKFLFGVSVSMVLAMAIGSFALSETQTPASPQEVEAQSAVGATVGPFTVIGGTQGTDYEFTGTTGTDGVLKIHPLSIGTNITISNTSTTTDRIEVTSAATIILAGVDINTGTGPALRIQDDATFNVNILLADGSNNILKATGNSYTGLEKNGSGDSIGTLTIGVPDGSTGTGKLEATGGMNGSGIGGGNAKYVSNITIRGGVVTATGGWGGCGIGSGQMRNGSNITITGGEVTATGGANAAGIGGAFGGNGSNITINGGVVKATGSNAAGIGGGDLGSASGNSLNGDAVVMATSGDASKPALEGFVDAQQESLLTQGIAFTRQTTSGTWSGAMYGNVTLYKDLEMLASLTVPAGNTLTVNQGVTLKIPTGKTLKNDGTITINNTGTIDCQGTITTKTDFYREGSTDVYTTGYQTYQTNAGVQKYTNLPNPDGSNDTVFDSWFTKPDGPDGGGTKVDENTNVLLNEHSFYEHRVAVEYTITVADLENGSITPNATEAAEDAEVALTVTPAEGYQLKEGSLTVTGADGNEVPVTEEEDGKYTFTMPGADVTVSAEFELIPIPTPPAPTPIPDPSVVPGHGGDGSDASSKTGDSFAGIAALAILGLATTGATLLRKRK